jgi:kanamycin kinase
VNTNDAETFVLDIPAELADEYSSWTWRVVSLHPGNSVAYRLSSEAGEVRFLKIVREGWTPGAEAEAERTEWARLYLPVPRILRRGVSGGTSWLLSPGIDGLDATHETFRADVPGLVTRLAHGLRRFHEAPASKCPFQFRIDNAMDVVRHRLRTGQIQPDRDFHVEFAGLTAEDAVRELARSRPKSEDLVVCHGDYCVPNVLLRENAVVGYVDLGELGVADRWWDLAVASWSITWNFGPGLEALFFDSYGVRPDEDRIRFYRLLYDLVS